MCAKAFKSDVEIAAEAVKKPIMEIAAGLGLTADEIEPYGKYKAKITSEALKRLSANRDAKLILVTAISPTPAGEGKTTTTIGLGQAMTRIGKKAVIALREPSLGPVFGVKGGAAGGGYAQVVPMDEINLHFTGDFHAITSANNLLSAVLDYHLHQGNTLRIDPKRIVHRRCVDMNDRALRGAVIGLGPKTDGVVREESFMITVATEVMAILCLADSLSDLRERLGRMIVAYNYEGKPVFCRDLGVEGAMCALLRDAVKPNLVQTVENTPCIIHGGPFANIAHGCNSVIATRAAMKLADYCITEAGFGADLGAEKFFDIKCRAAGLRPDAVVLVATVRALKYNGGVPKDKLNEENLEALARGAANLQAHIENLRCYGVPLAVAINHFYTDTDAEIAYLTEFCASLGVEARVSKAFAEGGAGATALAEEVCRLCETPSAFAPLYTDELSLTEKIETVARRIYRASGVDFAPAAQKALREAEDNGYGRLPVCIAKTQYSLSDDPSLLGCPSGHRITIRELRVSAGAGFVVALAGPILTMPGLPAKPAALRIDVDEDGGITGIF